MTLTAILAASTLAVCGAQAGHSYYAPGALTPPGSKFMGWGEDASVGARTTLTLNDKEEFDILFTDATGGVYSSRAEGAEVILARITDDDAAFVVAHTAGVRTVEVYQFHKSPSGAGELMLLQSKGHPAFAKAGVLVSQCSFSGLFNK